MMYFWMQYRVVHSPLWDYLNANFRPVPGTRHNRIVICVRQDRKTFVRPNTDGKVEAILPLASLGIAK